ncbi:MAG: hypothetical protein WCL10_04945 [Novosphingobium sp.]|uniref:hypothetical protein n=1 Tax=Novosphingobium sp. TaxID=1874826 RepID=UPI003017964A
MSRLDLVVVLTLSASLGACGDYLGDYTLDHVDVVSQVPSSATDGVQIPSNGNYLRIGVSSNTSLYAANTGPGLYTDADFCPMQDPERFIAFGPIASDGEPVEDYKRPKELKRGVDQRFHYLVYIKASSPPRKLFPNSRQISAYDLRTSKRDVCIRFHVPGYNIIRSRSGSITIPAKLLSKAPQA